MKRCPKCNAQFGDGATYCEYCGSKLFKPVSCPKCGTEVDENASFCPKCGASLEEEIVEVTPDRYQKPQNHDIEQYKKDIIRYKRTRAMMFSFGLGALIIGLVLFILFLALYYKLDISSETYFSRAYLYLFLTVLGELVMNAGLALLIVQAAVFGRKIANRQRIIDESENH